MIEDFLTWVHLTNLTAVQIKILVAKNQSNLIFIAYLLTIRKSCLFGAAFLLSDVISMVGFVPNSLSDELYGLVYYCALCLTWTVVSGSHIIRTKNKSLLTCCATMIAFLLIMAMDSYINAHTETFIWRNYENIILCIHVCIILSLYQSRAIIDRMVDKLHHFVSMLRNNYACSYFWYTVKNWQTQK